MRIPTTFGVQARHILWCFLEHVHNFWHSSKIRKRLIHSALECLHQGMQSPVASVLSPTPSCLQSLELTY